MQSRQARYIMSPRPIGTGGQAEVFEARDRVTNGIVALKRLTSRDPESIARMRREVEVQSEVRYPNIMPVIESSSGYQWYAMPLAERTLGSIDPPVSDELLIEIVESCAKGLAAAHAHGYIHSRLGRPCEYRLVPD